MAEIHIFLVNFSILIELCKLKIGKGLLAENPAQCVPTPRQSLITCSCLSSPDKFRGSGVGLCIV